MSNQTHPWGQVMLLADDFWHGAGPERRVDMHASAKAAGDLQFTLFNGLTSLNALLINHANDLPSTTAMDLVRMLASLAELTLQLRMFEQDTSALAEALVKEKQQ